MKKSDLFVYKSRNLLMQRIADHVVHGYPLYFTDTIPIERCAKLVRKFDLKYSILADRNMRARRKRNDLGNASMIPFHSDSVIFWWIMVTELNAGGHPAHSEEKLRDARDKNDRIKIDGYELVQLPKKHGIGTKYTWRMTPETYQSWRDSIIHAVRTASPNTLHNLLYRLWSCPGFSGVRSQVGHLVALYKAEVRRAGRKDAPNPPRRLQYLRRLKTQGVSLGQLMREIKANDKPKTTADSCDVLIVDTTTPAVKINAIDKNYSS
jgi:hypothetical protein